MQPRRPDSAKSRITQKTLDTQINQSKFAQTFSSYQSFQQQKKDEFLKYLQEKNKDPKFKKYHNLNLQEIPQKPKQQLSKINSKPFQKRTAKVIQKTNTQSHHKQQNEEKKQTNQQPISKWTITEQTNGGKKQSKHDMNSTSKSFASKNKEKLLSISAGLKKVVRQKNIQLKGFKVVQRGQKQLSNRICQGEEKNVFLLQGGVNDSHLNNLGEVNGSQQTIALSAKQSLKCNMKVLEKGKDNEESQQQRREQRLLEISQFIDELQSKNIDYYPSEYEQLVEKSQQSSLEELEMIDIKNFLIEPTENDYMKVRRLIRENQKRLDEQQFQRNGNVNQSRTSLVSDGRNTNRGIPNLNSNKKLMKPAKISSDTSSVMSINLDKVIDHSLSEGESQQSQQSYLLLSRISSKELKQRNVFLTEILKGRVTREEINKLQQMNKSQIKWHKLQSSFQEEQDIDMMEINMMKKKSNRVIERNIIQASGQIYRDCDYLSEENKIRLQKLLNGEMESSPFALSQWEAFAMRRIDEGIRLYRQYSSNLNQQQLHNEFSSSINQQLLPKDPTLRKQAQRKILKEKLNLVNLRLQQIQSAVISKNQIQQQLKLYQHFPQSEFTQSLIAERKLQVTEIEEKTKMAVEMLARVEGQKSVIQSALKELEEQYQDYSKECKQFQKLTAQQIVNRQRKELEEKKATIQKLEQSIKIIQRDTQQSINQFHHQLTLQIQILRDIEDIDNFNQTTIDEYQKMALQRTKMSVEELDAMFQKRLEENMDIQFMKSKMEGGQQSQDNKENIMSLTDT